MSQISVTTDELRGQSQVYIQAKEDIEQAIQRVNSMNSTIAEQWKGQAFQAYLEQYDQVYQNVLQFENLLENIHQQLNSYADNADAHDAEESARFGLQ